MGNWADKVGECRAHGIYLFIPDGGSWSLEHDYICCNYLTLGSLGESFMWEQTSMPNISLCQCFCPPITESLDRTNCLHFYLFYILKDVLKLFLTMGGCIGLRVRVNM